MFNESSPEFYEHTDEPSNEVKSFAMETYWKLRKFLNKELLKQEICVPGTRDKIIDIRNEGIFTYESHNMGEIKEMLSGNMLFSSLIDESKNIKYVPLHLTTNQTYNNLANSPVSAFETVDIIFNTKFIKEKGNSLSYFKSDYSDNFLNRLSGKCAKSVEYFEHKGWESNQTKMNILKQRTGNFDADEFSYIIKDADLNSTFKQYFAGLVVNNNLSNHQDLIDFIRKKGLKTPVYNKKGDLLWPRAILYKDLVNENQKKQEITEEKVKTSYEVNEARKEGVSREIAKKILGRDYLGPEAIKKTFGIELKSEDIPPIPFSREELKHAREFGEFLIFRTDQTPADRLYLLNGTEALVKVPQKRWALVSKEMLGYKGNKPDSDLSKVSTSKNYLEQTELIVKYLQNQVFQAGELPKEYQQAIAEFEEQNEELRQLIKNTDAATWRFTAQRLANLKITQLTRPSSDEILYDMEVYKKINNQYLLSNKYIWTSSASGSCLEAVGYVDGYGARINRWRLPAVSSVDLGVCFSRSV